MAFYRDLEPCDYFRKRFSGLLAVGWLSSTESYAQGEVDESDLRRLRALVDDCWQPFYFRGSHACEFCGRERGTKNLFVPGAGLVFVAPEMIVHYVEEHSYTPPGVFLETIEACAEMGSAQYFSALVEQGGRELAEFLGLLNPDPTPCPFCGRPLVTPRARQCRFCKMDWHDPSNPRKLGTA